MFHNMQGEYRAVIALKWFATESCMQGLPCQKSRIISFLKMTKIALEGFWLEVYARGSFMKYSMSENKDNPENKDNL